MAESSNDRSRTATVPSMDLVAMRRMDMDETKNKLGQILGRRIRLRGSESEKRRQLYGIAHRNRLDIVLDTDLT